MNHFALQAQQAYNHLEVVLNTVVYFLEKYFLFRKRCCQAVTLPG